MKSILKYFLLVVFNFSFLIAVFPDAIGENGAVTSSSKHASQIGIDVLENGGNAIDAAIAVGFALSVPFPNAGNLPRHPSQLYEAILEGLLIFLILFIMIKKNLLNYNGFISGSFLFLYGLIRIFVENFREPDLNIGYI